MSEALNIYSFNVRGLGDKYKREAVFSWLKSKGPGIHLIQESHSVSATERQWKSQWGGRIYFSHGTSNSKGAAILISPQLDITVQNSKVDSCGRVVMLECNFNGNKYIITNIYAPTIDKTQDQKAFGEYLLKLLQDYKGENIIIGGDFNINIECIDNQSANQTKKI